jgi:aspartate/glutamate racemase
MAIAGALKEKQGIQGLILGGTELSLIIKKSEDGDMKIFDTAAIHVQSILKRINS